jgi:spore coat polysaccharide biosynthesis protein SpsF
MSKNIIAIVQARMGSSRLPQKVMHKIANRPMIDFLLERLSYSKRINYIVLATSKNQENDPLTQFVQKQGYAVFRGDEENVLQRFYDTAAFYNADHIVRITGDSPLIDPTICDQLIDSYFTNNADYAYLSDKFCEGVDCEVFSFEALLKANSNAKLASELEHVTLYFHNNRNDFKITTLGNVTDDSQYRFTVDNKEDAILVTDIINHNLKGIGQLTTKDIKKYLDENPELKAIKKHIIRNEGLLTSLQADTLKKELFDE